MNAFFAYTLLLAGMPVCVASEDAQSFTVVIKPNPGQRTLQANPVGRIQFHGGGEHFP